MGEAQDGEEIVQCDLADKAAVHALIKTLTSFCILVASRPKTISKEAIMAANIQGTYNIYEAVHLIM